LSKNSLTIVFPENILCASTPASIFNVLLACRVYTLTLVHSNTESRLQISVRDKRHVTQGAQGRLAPSILISLKILAAAVTAMVHHLASL
jgi:hypothetical protein